MSSSSPPPSTNKKPIRELSSITNHLLLTKTLNAFVNNSQAPPPPPAPSTLSIKENIPNDITTNQQQKSLNLRLAAALKPVDNVAALLNFYQTLTNNNNSLLSNGHNNSSSVVENSSSFVNNNNNNSNLTSLKNLKQQTATKRSSLELTPMTYLCRFRQRNRLIEVPITSEYYHQQNGMLHEHLKQLIIQEFQLQQILKSTLIIQMWNEQYQEYIDIESFKRIPFEGRLQVLIEKDVNSTGDSSLLSSKSPSTPVSSHTITTTTARPITPIPLQTTPDAGTTNRHMNLHDEADSSPQITIKVERMFDESINTISPMTQIDNLSHPQHPLMYDLLPKPTDGIPIPRFPPHIAAFLNGNGDANQLNALVQALYQEIVKYELYPNADELRSIVSRLVDRYPHCISVIGSIELLVRKLYYKFCNERKKYPVELKRRQPNKRKRLLRDEDLSMINNTNNQQILLGRQSNLSNDFHQSSLDRLMHLWTTNDYKDVNTSEINQQQQQHSPQSGSSSNSSSPISNNQEQKYHPLNLSISTNNNNLMCTE